MTKLLIAIVGIFCLSTIGQAQMDEFLWAKQTKGNQAFILNLDQQSNKNIVNVGAFLDTIDLDPGSALDQHIAQSIAYDGFIQILDSNGTFFSSLIFRPVTPSSIYFIPFDVITDQQDNIYLSGVFNGNYDVDLGVNSATINSGSSALDGFVIKLSPQGDYLWHKHFSSVSDDYLFTRKITFDHNNDLIVSGYFAGQIDFDGGTGQHTLTSQGSFDGYVVKIDDQGSILKVMHQQSQTGTIIRDIETSVDSNYYFLGEFADSCTLNFDNGQTPTRLTGNGGQMFIMKTDSVFNPIWTRQISAQTAAYSYYDHLAIDDSNNVYVSITQDSAATLEINGLQTTFISNGNADVLFAKIDSTGNVLWAKGFGGPDDDVAGLYLLNANSPILVGYFEDSIDLNYEPSQVESYIPGGFRSSFITHFSPSGDFLNTHAYYEGYSYIRHIHIDGARTYLSGDFIDIIDADHGPNDYNLTNNNEYHSFLIKLSKCTPYIFTDSIDSCASYTWIDGQTYNSSTNIPQIVNQSITGCDSIVKLNFNYTPYYAQDNIQSCESVQWIDGNTYNRDTTVYYTTNGVDGCDSVVTLSLDIEQLYGVDIISTCQNSYTWRNGETYTSNNNTAIHTFTTSNGCDSLIYLYLTFEPPTETTDVITTCQNAYTWIDGNTYTSNNNTATHTLSTTEGCDSIVKLDLVFVPGSTGTDEVKACQSYTWIDGSTYTSNNNTATHTLTSSNGCDSVVTLDLSIGQPQTSTDMINACNEFTWIDGVTYTGDNNTATYVYQTIYGCDSTVSLDLTIDTVDTGLFRSNNTLTAQQGSASYQWYDCNSEQIVVGATQQFYNITDSSSYACIVTLNGCTDTTDCFDFGSLEVSKTDLIDFKIYPNPNAGQFTVEFGRTIDRGTANIYSMDGKLVKQVSIENAESMQMEYNAAPGVYWFELKTDAGTLRRRLVRRD